MAILTDWLDWLGGYPFEVASPEEIVDFYRDAGFLLKKIRTVGSKHGCNEFVLQKTDVPV
jgi:2-polyprenyl-6-hydroxyphenyl methylase/3-demethylubiquinone-9 3-methyltransferase